ncbi:DNA ligase D, partial [Burkholderia gladioli]|nr:DNA ligase D [Burkholderia gladioli]
MDLRGVSLEARRTALVAVLERNRSPLLRFSEDFNESPETMLNSACELKLEGLIGKRAGSLYESRRSDDWIKLKCRHRQEFVIAGYTEPSGSRSAFGALVLGLHDADSGELRYAGKVGTGFNEATLRTIFGQLKPLETKRSPLANPPRGYEAKGVHWVRPELLAEVAYAQMT